MVKRVEIIDELIHEVLPENSVTKTDLIEVHFRLQTRASSESSLGRGSIPY
jgi:hypothetical protein